MPRPRKCRKVCHFPQTLEFLPAGGPAARPPVILTVDEYETLRLIDREGLSQEQCGASMQIARTTVQQIYANARRKVAAVLVEGLPLRIEGGDYQLCQGVECPGGGCFKQLYYERYAKTKGVFIMRIAVTYEDGQIFQHFGHTQEFKVYDVADGKVTASEVVDTNGSGHGALAGVLSGVFRVLGSAADSVSYAIVISNMAVPLIDEFCVPKPYGHRSQAMESADEKRSLLPKPALALCVITLTAGVALSGVYKLTKDAIAQQQMAANLASYQTVCPGAESFSYDDGLSAAIESLGGEVYGTEFGKAYINEAVVGTDSSGNVAGYVISVTSGDGMEGNITLSVGLLTDGTVSGIAFTELNETPGLGSLCGEEPFMGQFAGVNTDRFILNKAGGSTADNEIDSVSGASISSGAIVNAVNAALDFQAASLG